MVERLDERLRVLEWPSLREVTVPTVRAGDCLLVCAGFEKRSIELTSRIFESGGRGVSLGLIRYLPELQQNRISELRKIGRAGCFEVREFAYDRGCPAGIGEQLRKYSKAFRRVFVDISGMSRLLIVQTLVALLAERDLPVSVIYGMAEEYPPSQARFKEDWKDGKAGTMPSYLSSGILDVAATPELGSVSMLGETVRLVAFPSFDPAQLTNLIQELQPTYAEYVLGIPPREADKWRTEAIRGLNERLLSELHGREQETSTLDYRETLDFLFRVYAERSMFDRLVIAPTGSKMQAVAVGLFRAELHDVQIVYPTPQVFAEPEEYTLGVRQLYQLDLPTRLSYPSRM